MQGHSSPSSAAADLDLALRMISAGETGRAREHLEALVRKSPGFVDARITLGRLLIDAGETVPALAQFRRAAEGSRGHPKAWGIYVSALASSGKKARARKAAKTAPVSAEIRKALLNLADDPSGARTADNADPGLEKARAISGLVRAGKLADAAQHADDAIRAMPTSAALMLLRGTIELAAHDPVAAEPFLRRALALDPASTDGLTNLALCLIQQARAFEAVVLLEPVVASGVTPLDLRINLASAYGRAGLSDKALALTDSLVKEAKDDPDLRAIRAEALIEAGRTNDALAFLKSFDPAPPDLVARALAASEGLDAARAYCDGLAELDVDVDLRVADVLAGLGELDRAMARARSVAGRFPDDPRALRAIGLYGRWVADDPLLRDMDTRARDQRLPPAVRGRFGKALGKALSDLGEPQAAFAALARANADLRMTTAYESAATSALFTEIAQTWNRPTIERLMRSGSDAFAPIFIIGLPRSGSTLIENVLSRHSAVTALGEWPVIGGYGQAFMREASARAVRGLAQNTVPLIRSAANGAYRVTDKLLSNFMLAGLLAATFPRARFVEASRSLVATGLSMFETPLNPASHPYALDLSDLGDFMVDYSRLMAHWETALGPRFLRCRYEDLVTAPEQTIRALLAGLDLEFEPACLAPQDAARTVNTMSVAQVRKPIHDRSAARWRAYAAELAPLTAKLDAAGLMDR